MNPYYKDYAEYLGEIFCVIFIIGVHFNIFAIVIAARDSTITGALSATQGS